MNITSNVSFYPCRDMKKTVSFYETVLKLHPVMKSETQCIFQAGGGYLGFVDYGDGILASGHICISFNLKSREEVDAVYQKFMADGCPDVKNPPAKHPSFPVYSFFFEDPNGYLLEFQKIDGIEI